MKHLAIIAVLLLAVSASGQEPTKKFYLTSTRPIDGWHAQEIHGKDRLDALAHSGLTVWTEAEWKEVNALAKKQNWPTPQETVEQRIAALEKRVAELVQWKHTSESLRSYGSFGYDCVGVAGTNIATCKQTPPCYDGRHLHPDGTCHDDKTDALVKP